MSKQKKEKCSSGSQADWETFYPALLATAKFERAELCKADIPSLSLDGVAER